MALKDDIYEILQEGLQPQVINVENQSHKHKGHAGDDGSGESHFSIYIVSDGFEGQSRIERHRMIFGILQNAFKVLPHAVSMKALTPKEL